MVKLSSSRTKGQQVLRDFSHAAKTFTASPGYPMSPKNGFNFHVRFVFNEVGKSQNGEQSKTISVLVKSVDLPKFQIDVDTLNKYNKREPFQKKITYEAVNIVFHDDKANNIRDMWLAWNQYYYADSKIQEQAYDIDDTYGPRLASRYGLDNGQTVRFMKSIEIYSMGNHKYTKYTLVNPMVASFDFDNQSYDDGTKVLQATMRVEYENVFYAEGDTTAIPGFGKDSPYYDNNFSTLNANSQSQSARIAPAVSETPLINQVSSYPVTQRVDQDVSNAPAKLTTYQVNNIKSAAINSNGMTQRFNFPTATEIQNTSSLVDLNPNRFTQGLIARSGSISSNGQTITQGSVSTNGNRMTTVSKAAALTIQPVVPNNLTATERQVFLDTYPPLPSTDARTRQPPYV